MRFPNSKIQEQIGYKFVLSHLDVVSPMGKDLMKQIVPFGLKRKDDLLAEYQKLETIMKNIVSDEDFSDKLVHDISKIKEIRTTLSRLEQKGTVLDEIELFEIKFFAKIAIDILNEYHKKSIYVRGIEPYDLKDVFKILNPENTEIMSFYIYEAYDERLAEIRFQRKRIEDRMISSANSSDFPKLLEDRADIIAKEDDLEYEIRTNLTKSLKKYRVEILQAIDSIACLDFLMAKCRLARKFSCTSPNIIDENKVILKAAYNPEIKKLLESKKKTFVNISLDLDHGVTLLTGANMGGKSITIKTVTLNIYLCQIGFYVFAEEASVPVFNFIHYVSDDMQSIERGLSTFGAEMIKVKEIVQYANATDGFIALDEVARGTNPSEGNSIVNGLVEYLGQKQSVSFISTHYDGICIENVKHYQVIGLKNIDFDALKYKIQISKTNPVDILQEYMDYRLELVDENLVPKDALNIAILLGLQEDLVDCIKKWYTN